MLSSFSWGHFLLASIVLNLIWYGFVILVFYRKEVLAFLGTEGKGSAFTHTTQNLEREQGRLRDRQRAESVIGRGEEASLMGASRLPDGVEVISSSQVAFSGGSGDGKYELVGLVADVVQELKMIFSELEKKNLGKPEFFGRVAALNEEYGPLSGHPNLGAINEFIRTSAPFAISAEELDNLWY
ncbi:MAG: hypothetical protein EOP48_05100 [Sphingobacteriales bacterium]|nr:MAG: hypothetical protein EOP48_05100 [Sphingobacteriales bacterium]